MENLVIQGTRYEYDFPSVHFNAETGECEISGESYLEKTAEFYDRLLEWLDRFMNEVRKPIKFNFKLTYFNTSTSKRLLHIMIKLREYVDKGGSVTANWYYHPDDIEIEEDVEDLRSIAKLDVNVIPDPNIKFDPFN
ncbi:MAG: hypothetical protein AMS27_08400 [Bacteroides sp. SM23_62_1]|nr:MAG: hypothetical protein AMS27_08400 [Bacteroides sp. SM23_62_1]